MLRRSQPMRRTGIRRTGIARRQPPVIVLPGRKAREAAKLWSELRRAVWEREGRCCAACGKPTTLSGGECHHRRLRSRGGPDTAFNCVWLCADDHRAAHLTPVLPTAHGWLVPSWADEHAWPVWQPGGREGWWQPTPDGWTPAEPSDVQLGWRKDRRTA